MRKVAHNVVGMLVNASDRAEVPLARLTHGTSLDPDALRRPFARLEWDDFTILLERLEDEVGFERLEALCMRVAELTPFDRRMLSAIVSPRVLYRFVNQYAGPAMYPMFQSHHVEESRDRFRLTIALREPCRPCHTFFRLMVPANAAVPTFIGLPPAEVRAHTHPRGMDLRIRLASASGREDVPHDPAQAVWLAQSIEDKRRFLEANEQLWAVYRSSLDERLDRATIAWVLSPRLTDVLRALARGRTNKEIATELRCAPKTVESHVTELLRRAGCDSRMSLVAKFWGEV